MTTAVAPAAPPTSKKALHIGLWVVQALLAVAFLGAGLMKLTTPLEELSKQMSFVPTFGQATRFIGFAEVAGALGLILPSATRILPKLTALAAAGLVTIMVLAAGWHLTHGEPIVPNLVLGLPALFIAWGRGKAAPIAPRA